MYTRAGTKSSNENTLCWKC